MRVLSCECHGILSHTFSMATIRETQDFRAKKWLSLLIFGKQIFSNIYFSSRYKIIEILHAAVDNAKEIESKLEDRFDQVWKKFEGFGENFPVLSKKVVPILEDMADNLEEQAEDSGKQIMNSATESLCEMKNHLTTFLKNVETIAGKSQDELRSKIVELKGKVQPYMDDVRDEFDRYVKKMY